MKNCPKCGSPNKINDTTCFICKHDLNSPYIPPYASQQYIPPFIPQGIQQTSYQIPPASNVQNFPISQTVTASNIDSLPARYPITRFFVGFWQALAYIFAGAQIVWGLFYVISYFRYFNEIPTDNLLIIILSIPLAAIWWAIFTSLSEHIQIKLDIEENTRICAIRLSQLQ